MGEKKDRPVIEGRPGWGVQVSRREVRDGWVRHRGSLYEVPAVAGDRAWIAVHPHSDGCIWLVEPVLGEVLFVIRGEVRAFGSVERRGNG